MTGWVNQRSEEGGRREEGWMKTAGVGREEKGQEEEEESVVCARSLIQHTQYELLRGGERNAPSRSM